MIQEQTAVKEKNTTTPSLKGLRRATRQKAKIKLGLSGASGSGKTYSALQIAYGMCGDWNKIAVIDSENGSADLYSHLGTYFVLPIAAPFHPSRYVEAITDCEKAGIEVIIIDSITHEWNGKGGCLDLHEAEVQSQKIPNSFTAWSKITPLHQKFIDSILQSKCHIITTVRSKTDYVLQERNGKNIPVKVGMAAQTRDGFEYELTLSFELDHEHKAFAGKDRTGIFMGKTPAFIPTAETGKKIAEWCELGVDIPKELTPLEKALNEPSPEKAKTDKQLIAEIKTKVDTITDVVELRNYYSQYIELIKQDQDLNDYIVKRGLQISK